MFNKKPQQPVCPDPFEDKVKCEKCRHWIDKSDAYKVVQTVYTPFSSSVYEKWYCPKDKVGYDSTTLRVWSDPIPTTTSYYRSVEVEEDGTPVGYKKIK